MSRSSSSTASATTASNTTAPAAAPAFGRRGGGPLRGVVPPMVTPLQADGHALDVAGLERLVAHIVGGGVHGLFILGTTGEAAALDDDVRRELVRRTCRLVAGRVPVLVGVTDTRVAESVRMARHAAESGADAVVVSTPFYLPLEQQELVTYVETIASRQPLPCFLYNIPALTKTAYEPSTVRRLADLPTVVGVKDSSGDPAYLQGLRQQITRSDWSYFVGTEAQLADGVRRGWAHGCVGGGANLAPRLFVSLYQAALGGDAERVAELQQGLMKLDRIYRLAPGTSSILRGLKCALGYLGVCSDRMGAPLRPCTPDERRTIGRYVDELNLAQTPHPPITSAPTPTPTPTPPTPTTTTANSHGRAAVDKAAAGADRPRKPGGRRRVVVH